MGDNECCCSICWNAFDHQITNLVSLIEKAENKNKRKRLRRNQRKFFLCPQLAQICLICLSKWLVQEFLPRLGNLNNVKTSYGSFFVGTLRDRVLHHEDLARCPCRGLNVCDHEFPLFWRRLFLNHSLFLDRLEKEQIKIEDAVHQMEIQAFHRRLLSETHEFQSLLDVGLLSFCPHCHVLVSKLSGCNAMQCLRCRRNFRYNHHLTLWQRLFVAHAFRSNEWLGIFIIVLGWCLFLFKFDFGFLAYVTCCLFFFVLTLYVRSIVFS